MPKPQNVTDLRDQLLDAFESVKTDPSKFNQVKEMTNVAGKVLASVKLQLEYSLLKGEDPEIPFMGETSGKPMRAGAKLLNA